MTTKVGKKTRCKEYLEYFFKWRNRGFKDASWVTKQELTHIQGTSISGGNTT